MFEVKISIAAPELVQAINNLAAALTGVTHQPQAAQTVQPEPNYAPADPTPAPATNPAPVSTPPSTPVPIPGYAYPSNQPMAYGQTPMQQQGYAPAGAMNPATPTRAGGSVPDAQTGAPAAPMAGQMPVYPSNQYAPVQSPAQMPQLSQPVPQSGVPLAQPPQYTIEQVMKAGGALMDAGRVDDLSNLLRSFGVVAVSDLKPEQLGAFATALRGLGAKI